MEISESSSNWRQRCFNDFENAKSQCLGKRDKSSAGRIDPRAVDICAVLNEREDCYTTSSCAGRCFMYRGPGRKSTNQFERFRISHEAVSDPPRYFDLSTVESDRSGGGDPIPTVGQYDYKDNAQAEHEQQQAESSISEEVNDRDDNDKEAIDHTIWLRYEPFILHVACRSLAAAASLMAAARPAFKNVGLTTWKDDRNYLVAIWGDEGLEMPMCTKTGTAIYVDKDGDEALCNWLAQLVNDRHQRNWEKIDRFVESVRCMDPPNDDVDTEGGHGNQDNPKRLVPKSFDVIGDIAYLHSLPEGDDAYHHKEVGNAIMKKNKAIKLVVARESTMTGTERAPGSLRIIAGIQRSPLITSHIEYGIKCVVDLEHTFFTPRMGPERLRICQQVARGEHVLVVFAGVAMDALQIAGRTEASSVIAVELNEAAVKCAVLGHRMLERNKNLKCPGAADRLQIISGDVMTVLPSLSDDMFDRILAPRPKEGSLDGDLGNGDGGSAFLDVLLPRLKPDGGECHWYDFVADHEFPECQRTQSLLARMCEKYGLRMKMLHAANVGSVAKRQLRVCIDFKVWPING